jgi:hypothetical protein
MRKRENPSLSASGADNYIVWARRASHLQLEDRNVLLHKSAKVKALGGLLSLVAVLGLVLGTPAHASGGYVPPGGHKCSTTVLANVGLYVSPDTKIFLTDKHGLVVKETLVAALVIDARLEVCVQVDVNAWVEIGAALPVDKNGDKKADYILSKINIIGDLDGHAKVTAKVKGKVAVFLAVKVFAQVDVDINLKKGEHTGCGAGAGKY